MEIFAFYIGVFSIGAAVVAGLADLIEFITRR